MLQHINISIHNMRISTTHRIRTILFKLSSESIRQDQIKQRSVKDSISCSMVKKEVLTNPAFHCLACGTKSYEIVRSGHANYCRKTRERWPSSNSHG